jgi:gag-polypeptide of LTR copia-type
MSTAFTTTDLLPSSVPKLMATGLNWTTFAMRFQDAIEAKGLWGYFDGTAVCPVLSKPPKPEEELALTQWIKEDRSAKALLTHHNPDSTLIRIHGKKSLKDRWDLISKEFSSKGALSQADLRTQFMESKCPDKGNVREFLDELRVKKEELATYGVVIEEKDYCSTIIKSLPPHLSAFASNLLAGARLYSSTKTIDPDELILLVSKEYERHAAQRLHRTGGNTSKGNDKMKPCLPHLMERGNIPNGGHVASAGTVATRDTTRTSVLNLPSRQQIKVALKIVVAPQMLL